MQASKSKSIFKHFSWFYIGIMAVAALVLGFWGFRISRETDSIWNQIYLTIQLFTLESGMNVDTVSRPLQFARFLAPLSTASAAIKLLSEAIQKMYARFRIRRLKGHVIICGFGSKGKNLCHEFVQNNQKVLVIENDEQNPNLDFVRKTGGLYIIGDASDPDILKMARLKNACQVFVVCHNDTIQLKIALQIWQILKKSTRSPANPLNCVLHLEQNDNLNVFKNHPIFKDKKDAFNLHVYNIYENSARQLLAAHPLDRRLISEESDLYVHLFVLGFGLMGEYIALQTAQMAHYANRKKARITIVDRLAQSRYAAFIQRYPAIKDICEITCAEMDVNNPDVLRLLEKATDTSEAIVSIALCFQDFMRNLVKGLDISHHLKNEKIPIFVRSTDEFEDDDLLGRYQHNFIMYGKYSEIGCSERLFRHNLDKLAMVNHAQFIAHRKEDGTYGTGEADQPWDLLDPKYKNSNRQAADHIDVKLRAIGCRAVNKKDAEKMNQPGITTFEPNEVELMAMMEHERWVAERLLGGWIPGTDKSRRRSPYLVAWDKLDEIDANIKSYDRGSVREIPEILARVGQVVVRMKKI